MTISAAALQAVINTEDTADDLALFIGQLQGDDDFRLSGGGDVAFGHRGNDAMAFASVSDGDTVFDFGGGNTLTLDGVTDFAAIEAAIGLF